VLSNGVRFQINFAGIASIQGVAVMWQFTMPHR